MCMHSLQVGELVLLAKNEANYNDVYISSVYVFSHRERYDRYRYNTAFLSSRLNVTLSTGHFVRGRVAVRNRPVSFGCATSRIPG